MPVNLSQVIRKSIEQGVTAREKNDPVACALRELILTEPGMLTRDAATRIGLDKKCGGVDAAVRWIGRRLDRGSIRGITYRTKGNKRYLYTVEQAQSMKDEES